MTGIFVIFFLMAPVSALGSFLSFERLLDRSTGCGPKILFECPNVCFSHPEKNSYFSFSFSGTITTYHICSIRSRSY